MFLVRYRKKGFTLIELLVVVAIIGILAAIVIGSLNRIRAGARDTQRIRDIKTIQTAFEIYYLDNGVYPMVGNGGWMSSSDDEKWSELGEIVGSTLPRDPVNEEGSSRSGGILNYSYIIRDRDMFCNQRAYVLTFNLETNDDTSTIVMCNGAEMGSNRTIYTGVDRDGNIVPLP